MIICIFNSFLPLIFTPTLPALARDTSVTSDLEIGEFLAEHGA